MPTPKPKKPIPYVFVLEELAELEPYTKPMFGCTAVYVGEKIVVILRRREDFPDDNGIWLATAPEHHASLQAELPSMRSLRLFGPGPTGWQNIPEESSTFEEEAFRVCALVRKGDPRIGKVPARKRPKKKPKIVPKRKKARKRLRKPKRT